jgi:phosphate transport system permease protein
MTTQETTRETTTHDEPGRHTAPATGTPPATTVPDRTHSATEQPRRRIRVIRGTDVLAVVGALAAALAMTGLLWTQLAPFTGVLGYVVTTWVLFVVIYALLVSFDESRPTMWDRVTSAIVHSLGVVLLAALTFVIVYTLARGWQALIHSNFYTQDLRLADYRSPLTVGGIKHAILGTLIEVTITLVIAVPLGLLGAVFLHEIPGRFSRFVRTVVEAMTALPDIVAGLFIYATLILIFGLDTSGLAAACALAVTILPIIIRTGDVVLRLVPGGLTEASYALGAGQWRTVWHILLPTSRSGLVTAIILGAARAIGETSPVLLTAGFTAGLNVNPVKGPMVSLPLEAYEAVQSSSAQMVARGFGSAATLLVLVLVLFVVARIIGGRGPGRLSGRQQRRRAIASLLDANRFYAREDGDHDDSPLLPAFGHAQDGEQGDGES